LDQLKSFTHGNGLVSNAAYDLDGRLTQLQLTDGALLVQGRGYSYSDGMNLTGIVDQVTAANSNALGYSAANRLTSAAGPWGTKTHSYDGVGNRITDTTTLGTTTTTRTQYYAPTSNRLDNIWQNGALLQYYNHDAAGNMIALIRTGESFDYVYNKRNRLSTVTRNGALWGSYVYNALEQLVSRTSNAPSAPLGTIHYIYDLDGHLIAEADGATGATLREYLWLAANDNEVADLPLAVVDAVNTATPITSFIHTDHLGRPTRMTSAAKATVWQATWTPWGEPQSISGTVTNNLRFPGQYFQIETGLAYNWHRHYDAVTGRYTQPDPLRFVDGPSIYAYAGNSPFMNVDREGRFWWVAGGAAAGIAIEYALNGDCATAGDYLIAGLSGALGGGFGGKGLVSALKGLSNGAKGNIGEALAVAKNSLKGRIKVEGRGPIIGYRARSDAVYRTLTGRKLIGEAKFGTSGLTAAQREAQKGLGSSYIVDKFTYGFFNSAGNGIGSLVGGSAGAAFDGSNN
jgi:RHS repeat-associated protein